MQKSSPVGGIHSGWLELFNRTRRRTTRRKFISSAAAGAGGLALWPMLPTGCGGGSSPPGSSSPSLPDQANWSSNNAIKHVVILCQENRSFDHYFGSFASMFGGGANTAAGFEPASLTYYNSAGTAYHPFHLTQFCDEDPDHSWAGSHAKWNLGGMNGWITDEGGRTGSIAYLEPADHIYDLQLARAFTLCDQSFCSQIGPTVPNRLYLWTGTSGWNYLKPGQASGALPYDNPSLSVAPPVLGWQTMADVLDAAGLPWKCYTIEDGSVPSAIGAFNPLVFFSQFLDNSARLAQATTDFGEFATDLAAGTLPAVSWIVTEAVVSEHPPASPDMGQLLVARVVQDLMASSAWSSTALFVTYDEAGGFFDHVPPTILEDVPAGLPDSGLAVGPAFRTPLMIVSPWAPPNRVFSKVVDHTSILQFIERTFSTPSTPITLATIPEARRDLANLIEAFDFSQQPNSPQLPTAAQLYAQANKTVLDPSGSDTCSTDIPSWLPALLGVS